MGLSSTGFLMTAEEKIRKLMPIIYNEYVELSVTNVITVILTQ